MRRILIAVVITAGVLVAAAPAAEAKTKPIKPGVAACRLVVKAQNETITAAKSHQLEKAAVVKLRLVKTRRAKGLWHGASLGNLARYCSDFYGPAVIGSVVTTTTSTTTTTTTTTTVPPTTVPPKPTAPPAPVETPGQANARRSAAQYLSLGNGFSRTGLIQQLSSSAGEGFSLDDATYGVDATHTDWNAQACLSAKSYLKNEPFSHEGLVEQLSSDAGEAFTPDEAEYGVTCAGL